MSSCFVRSFFVFATSISAAAAPVLGQASGGVDVRLRPGDALRVEIRDEPLLSGEFTIADDGQALLPLLGLVSAANRPLEEIRREIETGYARELVAPVVRVTPVIRVAVLGEVRTPGLFPVDPTHSLADVLAVAGGLTPQGDPDKISIVRVDGVVEGRMDPSSDDLSARLRSGDQIMVGRRGWLSENQTVLVGALASVTAAALTALIVR